MTASHPLSPETATALEGAPAARRLAACPFCHTPGPHATGDALAAAGGWRCVRCGHRWDAARLAAATAYAAWVLERKAVSQPPAANGA